MVLIYSTIQGRENRIFSPLRVLYAGCRHYETNDIAVTLAVE
jgi:hypothetical protein